MHFTQKQQCKLISSVKRIRLALGLYLLSSLACCPVFFISVAAWSTFPPTEPESVKLSSPNQHDGGPDKPTSGDLPEARTYFFPTEPSLEKGPPTKHS